jgi:hypothetical protein
MDQQKYFYIVDHFVPFPSSEYGGVWNVIAEDDDECFDLIKDYDEGFNEEFYVNLRDRVVNSRNYPLSSNEESRVVESFTT